MSDDLRSWIDFLHAAAAVPPGAPDYEEAQQAVEEALLRIRSFNRAGNQADQQELAAEDPGAMATFAGAANQNIGEGLGGTLGMAVGAMAGLPPQLTTALGTEAGKRFGLGVSGTDPEGMETAEEQHPLAGALGTTAGAGLQLLAGGLGARAGARSYGRHRILTGANPEHEAVFGKFLSRKAAREALSDRRVLDAGAKRTAPKAPTSPASDATPIAGTGEGGFEVQGRRATPKPPTTPTIAEMQGQPRRTLPYYPRSGNAETPKVPSDIGTKQMGVIGNLLRDVPAEEIPGRLAELRSMGIRLPKEAETLLRGRSLP